MKPRVGPMGVGIGEMKQLKVGCISALRSKDMVARREQGISDLSPGLFLLHLDFGEVPGGSSSYFHYFPPFSL